MLSNYQKGPPFIFLGGLFTMQPLDSCSVLDVLIMTDIAQVHADWIMAKKGPTFLQRSEPTLPRGSGKLDIGRTTLNVQLGWSGRGGKYSPWPMLG